MIDRPTARLCSRYLAFGLPFLYLLTSIAFYLHTYDSAQVKITIVQMGGILLAGIWYLTLACEREQEWRSYLPVIAPLLAALASGLLSFSHATYQGPSIDECLRRVFYIHFALIALKEINTLERMKRLVFYLLLATAVATFYGMIQFLDAKFFTAPSPGIDPFVWRQAFAARVFSTFGNPNFFGNFLVILAPITLALLLKRHSQQPGSVLLFSSAAIVVSVLLWQSDRLTAFLHIGSWDGFIFLSVLGIFLFVAMLRFGFLGVLFFLITFCTMATVSKGAWIGYAVAFISFLLLVLFYFSQFRSEKVRHTIQRAVFLTLAICVVGVTIYSRGRTDSLRFRICTWVSTWEMAQMHPIWGNGIGSFRILYPAFRRPQIFHIEGKHNTETDHAEDEYWEVLQDEGVIGLGIFLWFILTFSVLGAKALGRFTENLSIRDPASGKRKMTQDPRAFYMLGFLAAFWGMLIHNCMDVSLRFVSSGIFLWLLAGLIGTMVVHDPLPETDQQREARYKEDDQPQPSSGSALNAIGRNPALVIFANFACALGFLWLTYEIFVQFADTQGAFPEAGGEQLLWIIAWGAVLVTLGAALYALFGILKSLKHVWGALILAATIWPMHVCWGYFMADVYHNRGIFFSKQQRWEEAIANYRHVVALNPNYIMAYYFLGNVYTDRWGPGDFENAMTEYRRVWKIAPNYVQSHHQAGLVYLKKGQDDRKRFEDLRNKLAGNPGDRSLQAQTGQALAEVTSDFQNALMYFHKYHGLDPVFEPNYSRMAWVYLQLAELAKIQGHNAEAEADYDAAEKCYEESLGAWVCGAPYNDVLHEHWWRDHRHFTTGMFKELGDERFIRGRVEQAVKAYKMSLWRDPKNTATLKNLASAYVRLNRQGDAFKIYNELRTLAPQDPDVQRMFHGQQPISPHP